MKPGGYRSKIASAAWPATMAWLLAAATVRAEETPRSAMRKGLRAYKAGDYTNAVQMLEKTVPEFPDIGNYDLGNALYRQGDYEAAEKAYTEALRSTDLKLQAKAYYNLGDAMLARTTTMTRPEQIGQAAELAFQAADHFEKAIQLDPQDMDAKRNFEKALRLRLKLEEGKGKWMFDAAEADLKEYKAKEAQQLYNQAKQQFEHILADIDPGNAEAKDHLPKIADRLEMLRKAVEETEQTLATALKLVDDYQYKLAAERLGAEDDNKKYAFDLKPDLKKRYEETIRKNGEVLKIIQDLSNLNL